MILTFGPTVLNVVSNAPGDPIPFGLIDIQNIVFSY